MEGIDIDGSGHEPGMTSVIGSVFTFPMPTHRLFPTKRG